MDRVAKRYLITGAIGITAMLSALGYVLFKASEKVGRADSTIKPTFGVEAGAASAAPAPSASAGK